MLRNEFQTQKFPLIRIADEAEPSLDDSSRTCSMGADGDRAADDRCLCDLLHVRHGAQAIAVLELVFILYEIFTTAWFFDKHDDSYVLAVSLILSSFVLALIAVILLFVGVQRTSPYLLIPHLLMQLAVVVANAFLSGYLTLLLIGGTSVDVETVIYEDSPRGELGLTQSSRYDPIQLTLLARGLKSVLVVLLLLAVASLVFQVWFLAVVRRCYVYLCRLTLDKPLIANGSTDTKSSKI